MKIPRNITRQPATGTALNITHGSHGITPSCIVGAGSVGLVHSNHGKKHLANITRARIRRAILKREVRDGHASNGAVPEVADGIILVVALIDAVPTVRRRAVDVL